MVKYFCDNCGKQTNREKQICISVVGDTPIKGRGKLSEETYCPASYRKGIHLCENCDTFKVGFRVAYTKEGKPRMEVVDNARS